MGATVPQTRVKSAIVVVTLEVALGHRKTVTKVVRNLIATHSGTFLSATTLALVELVPRTEPYRILRYVPTQLKLSR